MKARFHLAVAALSCLFNSAEGLAATNASKVILPPQNVHLRMEGQARPDPIPLRKLVLSYGELSGRAVMVHPRTPDVAVCIEGSTEDKRAWVAAVDSQLTSSGVIALPLGDSLVAIAPVTLTNELRQLKVPASEPAQSGGAIDFQNLPVSQALTVYAALLGKTLKDAPPSTAAISFKSTKGLSHAEVVFALKTLFEWNGVVLEEGEKEISATVWNGR